VLGDNLWAEGHRKERKKLWLGSAGYSIRRRYGLNNGHGFSGSVLGTETQLFFMLKLLSGNE
jgi:hypothetical protein